MDSTIELLRFIGSPYSSFGIHATNITYRREFYQYSAKNRLLLLYLDSIKQIEPLDDFSEIYEAQTAKYHETFEAVERISHILSKAHIMHAVFKSVRPYIFNTVDIDVIIFGNQLDYEMANKTVQNAGYEKVVRGPASTTFRDPKMKIGIDLYNEVSVSCTPYIDKDKLEDCVVDKELPNGAYVKTLTCEADLLSIVAHSVIKENMYVLSEYYTYIDYLDQLDVGRFVRLAKETHLKSATRIHTAITALLHKAAYKNLPQKVRQIQDMIGGEHLETSRVIDNRFRMPHRYHPLTVANCLFEVARERKTMKGLASQAINVFNQRFLRDFLERLREHITRETY